MPSNSISVVVRCHDSTRIFELERALISLLMQSYNNVEVIVVTQRFKQHQTDAVQALVSRLKQIDSSFKIHIHNFVQTLPKDARSALLNLGVEKSQGRFLAFLDYDDVMQPHAYEQLIDAIESNSAAIAFGGIATKFGTLEKDYCLLRFRGETYTKPLGLADLLHDNHCPIHSFVIDRSAVAASLIRFEDSVQRAEDYQFLLRICAKYKADFSLKTTVVGDYYFKDDGSNTTVTSAAHPEECTELWRHAADAIASEREKIVLAPAIQRSLGIHPRVKPMSITEYLRFTGKLIDICEPEAQDVAVNDIIISETMTGLPPWSADKANSQTVPTDMIVIEAR